MKYAEREVPKAQLPAGFVELMQGIRSSSGVSLEYVEKGRSFQSTESAGVAKCDQGVLPLLQGLAPGMQRKPAPVRLLFDRRKAFHERSPMNRIPTRLVEGAQRKWWGDDHAPAHSSVLLQDLLYAPEDGFFAFALRLGAAIAKHAHEVLDCASPHRLERRLSVLFDHGVRCMVNRGLSPVVLASFVRWVGFRSTVIEKERPQGLSLIAVGGFLGQGFVERDGIRHQSAIEHETRHLPGINGLREREDGARQARGNRPGDQLEYRLAHLARTLPRRAQRPSFRGLLSFPRR